MKSGDVRSVQDKAGALSQSTFRKANATRSAVQQFEGIKVLFVSGFGPVVRDAAESRRFYKDTLGLPLEPQQGGDPGYFHSEKIAGTKHFALWPLEDAANSCFGQKAWPKDFPVPQAWLEFDVEDVASSARELKQRGYRMLVEERKEPWGQTVSRLLSPEGILVGLVITPWLR
jgi:catechol 2,3-dioxygenase-like lactoylglutathione lyase family enzyme